MLHNTDMTIGIHTVEMSCCDSKMLVLKYYQTKTATSKYLRWFWKRNLGDYILYPSGCTVEEIYTFSLPNYKKSE